MSKITHQYADWYSKTASSTRLTIDRIDTPRMKNSYAVLFRSSADAPRPSSRIPGCFSAPGRTPRQSYSAAVKSGARIAGLPTGPRRAPRLELDEDATSGLQALIEHATAAPVVR